MKINYTDELIPFTKTMGAVLAGAADLKMLESLNTVPINLLERYRFAFSIAVVIPQAVIDSITVKNPGEIYSHYYKTANLLLDQITFRLSEKITNYGFSAFAIPASLYVNQDRFMGNASHKAFARAAGLGWIGKNTLLITRQYGPRVRLGTVLTDIPLIPGKALENECGDCVKCIDLCPAKAIQPSSFIHYPVDRSAVLDVEKCSARLDRISQFSTVGVTVCGICIKVCPIGFDKRSRIQF
ncbi:MAG: 4Fe-4S double cluster binding domain-containing protein [Candidatus Hodarchaeales archaeon]|jgi:epoxyqueuosine reductase QueG